MLREISSEYRLGAGQVLIYALADPTTGAIRFVGTTSLPAGCLRAHMSGKRSQNLPGLAAWVAGIVEAGMQPTMLQLAAEEGDFIKLCRHEAHWINRLREMGEQLFNA